MGSVHVAAVDLGASSGRVIRVGFDGTQLVMDECNRFPNIPVAVRGSLHWDVLRLWHEIQAGLRACGSETQSIGVDTWGVDFALLDRNGALLANPLHYRDSTSDDGLAQLHRYMPRREIFERTGIQFMPVNGINRMVSLIAAGSPLFDAADTMLTIADLFNYWLSGSKTCEFTMATTWQLYNPRQQTWDLELARALGIPERILAPIVSPGTVIGEYEGIRVIAPACHDTGSAVIAVPTTTRNYAYISSGTWSLMGLELDHPIINDEVYRANLTNEGGIDGTFRFLKNIMGLWLVQQCRETWSAEGRSYSYDELVTLAATADPFKSLIDPDDHTFFAPGDMPSRIRAYCAGHGQPVPQSDAEVLAAIYAGLAFKYRFTLDQLVRVSDQQIDRVHVIGGGSQNRLLCQMTANALGKPVYAGPVEATALGNAIVQFMSLGELGGLSEARELLSRSMITHVYEPQDLRVWDEHYARFVALLEPADGEYRSDD
jgi:sugar (pentulose or hexulose) kinase